MLFFAAAEMLHAAEGALPSVPILLVGAVTDPGSALILSQGHGENILSLGSATSLILFLVLCIRSFKYPSLFMG